LAQSRLLRGARWNSAKIASARARRETPGGAVITSTCADAMSKVEWMSASGSMPSSPRSCLITPDEQPKRLATSWTLWKR